MLAAHHSPISANPAGHAPAPPTAARKKNRSVASFKRCNHDSCTKYKQTGCHGYCLKHVKLYHADLVVDGVQRGKRKKIEPPTVLLKAASIVKSPTCPGENSLELLVEAGARDPSLWKCPTFSAAMMAAVHQAKSPAK